ncbi:efflux RND transporter periplasmic adaptor subunit [Corallincola spongiicola]|uniref:Efflux RND transporter periplasmic adaptor subunit n=1 Tax=Corallincola spongiicola TaxID=2520508 RepID=A0ABY1WSM6_9GAMM|nr:efflux RND transporter periplasmic adaptor subunit [Corallincola spongiicola]
MFREIQKNCSNLIFTNICVGISTRKEVVARKLKNWNCLSQRWCYFIALFGLGSLLQGCSDNAPRPAPPPHEVKVISVTTKTVPFKIPRLAQIESSREVAVVARVSGFLDKINYDEGTLIKEGDVMFEMDKRPFISLLNAAKGELEAAKARLWTAEANLKRIQPLAEADAMSQSDLDTAIGEQQAAKAAVFAAKANVTSADLDLSYATIKAPATGLTGAAEQREGAYLSSVSESANLSYVAQLDPIWVNFAISQNEMEDYQRQQDEGLITTPTGKKFSFEIVMADGSIFPHTGYLDFASPIYDSKTGTVEVRAVVPNPDFHLRPGMFVSANLLGAIRPNAIVVPQQAVQQSAKGQAVLLVNDKNIVEERPITTGEWVGDGWIVENGLSEGDSLIVDGFKAIRPGMQVKALHYIPKAKSGDAKSKTGSPKADSAAGK